MARPTCEGAERILAAAEELFAKEGFDAVSMNAIADKAGVSKANVFHHFKSKNDLYLAVIKQACQQACAFIDNFGSDRGPSPSASSSSPWSICSMCWTRRRFPA
jgi:TetR/AcrR family transcriptional regulator